MNSEKKYGSGIDGIVELQEANGQTAKLRVIEKYKDNDVFLKMLYYTLNPRITYNLSEDTLRSGFSIYRLDVINCEPFDDIFDCCEFLSNMKGMDLATLRKVLVTIYDVSPAKYVELFIKILSKTLRLGVTAKTVNKVMPGYIPEWEVQQAFPIEKYPVPEGKEFWLTQKLNGVRATFYRGELIARSGQPFDGLDHIVKILNVVSENGAIVLDGELTLNNNGGLSDNEAFRKATGILNAEGNDKSEICYTVFDAVSIEDFESENPKEDYASRRDRLDGINNRLSCDCVRILPALYHGKDQKMIWKLLDRMVREDKEGLMLNTNCVYRRTRHKGILKVKQFYTMDLPIVGFEEGTGRLTGKLGAFVLEYKGNAVKVGSGFSDEQRARYWHRRDDLVGTLCEVKYKEISYDKKTGLQSLQFPVFIRLREDKSEVSYG